MNVCHGNLFKSFTDIQDAPGRGAGLALQRGPGPGYHRDAHGLYTPPAYLDDELSSDYDYFLVNGPISAMDDTERNMDGTVKHFIRGATVTDPSGRTLSFTWTDCGTVNAGMAIVR